MVFTVLCACDLYGKCNFEFTFADKPSVSELLQRIEVVLGTEAALRRPPNAPVVPFQILRNQVFDERIEMWVDLVASGQLQDYCQCYVFQKETPWHKDSPGRIPPAVRPSQVPQYPPSAAASAAGFPVDTSHDSAAPHRDSYLYPHGGTPPRTRDDVSPFRARAEEIDAMSVPDAHPAAHIDKVRSAYDDLDTRTQRRVMAQDWREAFERLRLGADAEGGCCFSAETIGDLFAKADADGDGVLTFGEFERFCDKYPKLLDSLFFRGRLLRQEALRKENNDAARAMAADIEQKLSAARADALQADDDTADVQRGVDNAEAAVEEAKRQEAAQAQTRDDLHRRSEDARGAVREAAAARDRARNAARQREQAVGQAARGVDAAQKRAKHQEGDLARAQGELDRLRALVAQQEKEVVRQQGLVDDAKGGIEQAKVKVAEADTEKQAADTAAERAQDDVASREAEQREALQQENDATRAHRDLTRALSQAQAQKASEDQALAKAKAKQQAQAANTDRMAKMLEEHKQVVDALDEKEQQLVAKRAAEEVKENDLLVQEVKLREQRAAVEQKELALYQAHNDFSTESGRVVSPQRTSIARGSVQGTPYYGTTA